MDDKELELYHEENLNVLKSLNTNIQDLSKLFKEQIKLDVKLSDEMKVSGKVEVSNPIDSVKVNNLEDVGESLDNLAELLSTAIKNNSYKPLDSIKISNADELKQETVKINNLKELAKYFESIVTSIKNNRPIVNVEKENLPRSARNPIAVRLSDGRSFYKALESVTQMVASGGGGPAAFKDSNGKTAQAQLTASGAVPVDIQDATVVIEGDVTLSSEVEVKNDAGNPVPVTDAALAGYVDGIESVLAIIQTNGDTVETKLQSLIDNTDGLEGFVDGVEGLLTSLNGYVDGLETLVAATNSSVDGLEGFTDGLETLIGTLNGYVDGLETLVTSTNTKLDTINTTLGTTLSGYLDQLEGYTDGLEALITSTNGYVDQIEGYIDTVETKLQSIIDNTKASTPFVNLSADIGVDTIKGSAGVLNSIQAVNTNTIDCIVVFYDIAGAVTVGVSAISYILFVPKGDGTNYGASSIEFPNPINFANAIKYATVTTAFGDPTNDLVVMGSYI